MVNSAAAALPAARAEVPGAKAARRPRTKGLGKVRSEHMVTPKMGEDEYEEDDDDENGPPISRRRAIKRPRQHNTVPNIEGIVETIDDLSVEESDEEVVPSIETDGYQ
jgi:hypothetical protein